MTRFTVTYEVSDGYAGASRPHSLTLDTDDFDPEADNNEIQTLIEQAVQEDFQQNCTPVVSNIEKAVAFVLVELESAREEEDEPMSEAEAHDAGACYSDCDYCAEEEAEAEEAERLTAEETSE